MGRLSKHRKRKNVSLKVKDDFERFNLPPDERTEKLPRSFKRMLRDTEAVAQNKGKKRNRNKFKQDTDPNSSKKEVVPKLEAHMDHETLEDFNKRIDRETRTILDNQEKANTTISQRRKDYYNRRKEILNERRNKKKKKKGKKGSDNSDEEDDRDRKNEEEEEDEEDGGDDGRKRKGNQQGGGGPGKKRKLRDFSDLTDYVQFGEVIEQPPPVSKALQLRKEKYNFKLKALEPEEAGEGEEETGETLKDALGNSTKKNRKKGGGEGDSRALELYREQVVERYRQSKKLRAKTVKKDGAPLTL